MKEIEIQIADEYVCALFGLKKPDLRRQCRKQPLPIARQMVWKILKELKGFRICELSREYKRDQGAIHSGIKRVTMEMEYNRRIEMKYKLLKDRMINANNTTN